MAHPSVSYAQEISRLTIDPGARRIGEILDDMQQQMDALQAQVDACCGTTLANTRELAGSPRTAKPASNNDSPPGSRTNQ